VLIRVAFATVVINACEGGVEFRGRPIIILLPHTFFPLLTEIWTILCCRNRLIPLANVYRA